jgi:hypothetical protein
VKQVFNYNDMKNESKDLPKGKPILSIDFDGVLHSYTSGWKGARNIPDPPIPGAIDWLKSLIPVGDDVCGMDTISSHAFQVAIFSSRGRYLGGRKAMKKWLMKYGITSYQLENIKFPILKPPSFILIDDRALQFRGYYPPEDDLKEFKPWRYKKGEPLDIAPNSCIPESVLLRNNLIRFLKWHDAKFGSEGGDSIIAELIDEFLKIGK